MNLEYTAEIQPSPKVWLENIRRWIYPYYPDDNLKEAVNLAIRYQRPLLLEGEPGSGKSRLAHALVYEYSQRHQVEWPFEFWNVQSTSKAQDGFYTYDYIGRLQAAQLKAAKIKDTYKDPASPEHFVNDGPLGRAFEQEHYRTVVLIDEIDKADRDFPNDLLLALEEQRIEIKELPPDKRWLVAKQDIPPIVIITSNRERDLPDAFLRRCFYHYIEFPKREQLEKIINARFENPPAEVVKAAIDRFLDVREAMEERGEKGKKVSTSELIDWFATLNDYPPEEVLKKLKQDIPAPGMLLKTRQHLENYRFI